MNDMRFFRRKYHNSGNGDVNGHHSHRPRSSWRQTLVNGAHSQVRRLWRHRALAALLLVVCVFGAEFALLPKPKANAAYTIANSARFISGNSDYLSRTPGSTTSTTKWTWSGWVKRSKITSSYALFGDTAGNDALAFRNSG